MGGLLGAAPHPDPGRPGHAPPHPCFPAESQTVSVLAPRQVRGLLGDNATLPCKLQTQDLDVQVTLVSWLWQDPAGRSQSMAVFHPTQGPSYPSNPNFPEPGRLEFVAARPGEELRDATLVVRGLRAQDEANYTCHFATFPHGSKSASTWLRVLGERGGGGRMGEA